MLAYERHGSGDPVVLVHGVTHRRQAWYPVVDRLAEQRDVILVDLPGHGESPAFETRGQDVVTALRGEFRAFLDHLGIHRPHVAGNSLGGLVALHAGASGDARSVTAFSPAGFWKDARGFANTKRIFTAAAAASERFEDPASALSHFKAGRSLMYGLLMAHPGKMPADHAHGDYRAFCYARPALRMLLDSAEPFEAEIPHHVPVTIAWAARDLVLPKWQAAVAKTHLPRAEHIMMRGVGHVPMFDKPDLVADIILRATEPTATVATIDSAPSRRGTGRRRRVATA
jgi:pimeloyl-ACP methyl ester carboxylesterase